MAKRLSLLSAIWIKDPQALRSAKPRPVLVWEEAPPPTETFVRYWDTQNSFTLERGNDPLVYPLEKRPGPGNGFALGITLGRTNNNDLSVNVASVSRFHAFFQEEEHSRVWHVVDAQSSNGTYCSGERLPPGRPAPLADGLRLRFGGVEMRFLLPEGFEMYLRDRARK